MSTCDGTRNIRAVPRRNQRHERHTKTVVTSPLQKYWPRKSNTIYTLEGLGLYGSPTPQHGPAPAASPQTRHSTRARRWVWDLGRAGVVALGYFLSAKVGLAFVVQPEGLAAVWPPSGFLLAVLVLSPQRAWAV